MILMQPLVSLGRGEFWNTKTFKTLSQSLLTVTLLFVALMPRANAQSCVLACSPAQISLDMYCEAEVTVSMLADTSQCPAGSFVVHVLYAGTSDTIPGSPVVTDAQIGVALDAHVVDVNSGQSCWSSITVEDKLPPQITCNCPPVEDPEDAAPECIVNCLDAVGDSDPVVVENCSTYDLFLVGETIEAICDPQFIRKLTRKYIAVDEAGNYSDTCEQVLFLERIDFSLINWPDSLTIIGGNPVLCDGNFQDDNNDGVPDATPGPWWLGGGAGVPRINGIPVYPDFIGTCNAQIFVEDVIIGPIGCTKKVMRMWTAYEWHCTGERDTLYIQLIEITDEEGPILTCPDDKFVSTGLTSCDAIVYLPLPGYSDNCHDVIQISATWPGGFADNILETNGVNVELPAGWHEITYTAYDECYNSSECTWTVHVEDHTPPIPICDQHTVVALTTDGPYGLTLVPAHAFDDGSYDECGDVTFTVRRMTSCIDFDWTTNGAFIDQIPDGNIHSVDKGTASRPGVPFACCDVGAGPIMVELRVADEAGNVNFCMVEITVQDKIGPFITCPSDITISCTFDYDMEDLSIFGTVETDLEEIDEICLFDPANPNNIGGFTCWGDDGYASDNCEVVVTESSYTDINSCGVGYIRRTFTATDPGGRTNICHQYIYIHNYDPFDPEYDVEWPEDVTSSSCGASTDPETTGFPDITEDECDLIGFSYTDQVFPFVEGACFKILRTWKIIDWCQFPEYGPWQHLQIIKVIDVEDPEFVTDQPDLSVCNDFDCGDQYIELIQRGSDDCTPDDELNWSYAVDLYNNGTIHPGYVDGGTGNVIDASGDYPIGSHRILYTFEDNCGNKTTVEQFFEILACKPPTPICLNGLSADLMPVDTDNDGTADWGMVTIWANDFDKGSLHDCGYPVTVSFSSDTTDKSKIFDCSHVGVGPVLVQLWVTDLVLGNQAYCETYIIIQDNMGVCPLNPGATGVISGEIQTEDAEKVNAVNVSLNGSALNPVNTNGVGQFIFPAMPVGGTYTVRPEKNDDWSNGISTLDLIRIQKHLLGLQHLGSPYKLIAADANNSGSVSAVDLVMLRKLILGTITEIDNNTSWRFVDGSYNFLDPSNPFGEEFPESYVISPLSTSMAINFKAIKVGDVNNSVQANLNSDETETSGSLTMKLNDQNVIAGELVEMTFTAEQAEAMMGYQFTLNFDSQLLAFVSSDAASLDVSDENFGLDMADQGVITTSWSRATPVNVSEGDELFTITFRAKSSGTLNGNVWIGSTQTRAESYDAEGNVNNVELVFENTVTPATAEFALLQNTPNPFAQSTNISFTLPEAASTNVTIYDMTGKVIYTRDIDAVAGYNELTVNASELQSSGVMYYNVKTENFSATRKMLMIR